MQIHNKNDETKHINSNGFCAKAFKPMKTIKNIEISNKNTKNKIKTHTIIVTNSMKNV
jgi:hypothetical protein